MKTLVLLLLCSIPAFAAKKPEPIYQDAVLKSYRSVNAGQRCSGSAHGTVSGDDIDGSTDSVCRNTRQMIYTVAVGEQIFELAPSETGKKTGLAMATMGYSRMFAKDTALYGQLPGAPIKIRSDGGKFWIKVGKRESVYRLVGAQ